MRVVAFCDYFSGSSSGGSERAAWEIYQRLASKGVDIRVITTLPKEFHPFPSLPNLDVRSAPMTDLQRTLGLQAGLSPALFLHLRRLMSGVRPDVLHANSLFFQTSVAAALAQRLTGTPLVTTAHIAGLDFLRPPARFVASAYERSVGRFILSRSRQVIAVSDSVRDHMLELGVQPNRITVVPNGVDLNRFHPSARQSPSPLAREGRGEGSTILFIGRLIPNKGPHLLLEALLALQRDGVPFLARFLGDGPMRRELERRAVPLGTAVQFPGHVQDVAGELRAADLVVRPSLTEGLPLTVLEAMASAVCVVASNIAGNRDLIEDHKNGLLVPPNDPSALAIAIRRMIQNPAERQQLASAGRATPQRYSWDAAASAVSTVLERAAGLEQRQAAA